MPCLIETDRPGFPSALIVSRYTVSAHWLKRPLPVCLCVWNEGLSASVCELQGQTAAYIPTSCLSVWWQTDPLCLCMCRPPGRSQTVRCYSLSHWQKVPQYHVFFVARSKNAGLEITDIQEMHFHEFSIERKGLRICCAIHTVRNS